MPYRESYEPPPDDALDAFEEALRRDHEPVGNTVALAAAIGAMAWVMDLVHVFFSLGAP